MRKITEMLTAAVCLLVAALVLAAFAHIVF